MNSKFIAIDTEGSGLNVSDGRDRMNGVSIAYRTNSGNITAVYLPFFHRYGPNYQWSLFKPILQQIIDTRPTIYHNAPYDIPALATRGICAINSNFYDTMLLAHQVGETTPYSRSLDSIVGYYLPGIEKKKNKQDTVFQKVLKAVGWDCIPSEIMTEYAAYDAELTLRVFEPIWKRVVAEGTEANWRHKREMVRLIVDMKYKGVLIDQDLCELMAEKGEREMERIALELGGAPTGKFLEDLILNKLKLKPQYNFDKKTRLKKERPTFDAKAMEIYEVALARRSDTTAQRVLEYRGWQKATSSNYKSYLKYVSPDGRLRPSYRLDGTKTGRLSCADPNLQQIPRGGQKPWNGKMKACFVAQPGYVLVGADYSQLEFRLGAAYAQEPKLLDIFNDLDRDIFDEMAIAFDEPRDDSKTKTYSIQYGAGKTRISTVFNISMEEAGKVISDYYDEYPGLRIAQKQAENTALYTGRVKLWSGRFRHFQYPKSESFKAFNSAIQGGAADIVERTMLRCATSGLNSNECRMLLQVHDEIIFEVREDKLRTYIPQIRDTMQAVDAPPFSDRVKFPVAIHRFGSKESLINA